MSDVIDNQAVLDQAEKALDVIEDRLDEIENVVEVVRNNPAALAVVGFAGVSIGAVAGYFVARHKLKKFYEDLATMEIQEAKEFYSGVFKTDEDGAVMTPQEVLAQRHGPDAIDAIRVYRGQEGDEEAILERAQARAIEQAELHSISLDTEPGPHGGTIEVVHSEDVVATPDETVLTERTETRNVFVDPNFDYEEELKHRTADRPYVITHDEFFSGDVNNDTSELTYFEEDDTLVNEQERPMDDKEGTVGEDNLIRFGHGSKDKNIVYVRNEKLGTDYSITRSTGSYVDQVLGLGPEPNSLKHSNRDAVLNRRRDFRRGDG